MRKKDKDLESGVMGMLYTIINVCRGKAIFFSLLASG